MDSGDIDKKLSFISIGMKIISVNEYLIPLYLKFHNLSIDEGDAFPFIRKISSEFQMRLTISGKHPEPTFRLDKREY